MTQRDSSLATAMTPHLALLSACLDPAGRPDGSQAFEAVVTHLHRLVAEFRPSAELLRATLDFLTEVGQVSDDRRQAWVLLADVLGVSTLVDDLAHPRPVGATPNTLIGPFYRPDVPDMPNGAHLSLDARGEPLRVTGRVTGQEGAAVPAALIEVWHANPMGFTKIRNPTSSRNSACAVAFKRMRQAASPSTVSSHAATNCCPTVLSGG